MVDVDVDVDIEPQAANRLAAAKVMSLPIHPGKRREPGPKTRLAHITVSQRSVMRRRWRMPERPFSTPVGVRCLSDTRWRGGSAADERVRTSRRRRHGDC